MVGLTCLVGFAIAWPLLARAIFRRDRDMGPVFAAFFGGALSTIWPLTLVGLAVVWWLERPPAERPAPKPPTGGPFR